MPRAYTIHELERAYREQDLPACHTETERITARAVHGKAMRTRAAEVASTRTLTPAELAILHPYGYEPTR